RCSGTNARRRRSAASAPPRSRARRGQCAFGTRTTRTTRTSGRTTCPTGSRLRPRSNRDTPNPRPSNTVLLGRAVPTLVSVSVYLDLFRYRELFANLWQRDLRAKYKGSILGVAWSLANPLILMGIYVLVFSALWRVADMA